MTFGHHVRRRTAIISRWLHLYLSLFSFTIVLFFAATGLTLNHPDWFASHIRTINHAGSLAPAMLAPLDKLAIAESLRKTWKLQGAVSDFRIEDSQITVSFRGPGYAADAFIDRPSAHYQLTETRNGIVAVMNDLHKGRDTGPKWSWVIDASAILLVVVSLTGLTLIFFLAKRRKRGIAIAIGGLLLLVALCKLIVP
ncbi:MAG: PepSY-associated TM helix domain-containing protein [Granulicella sp.]